MANLDFVMSDGKVHDPQRIDFLQKYIGGLEKAAGGRRTAGGIYVLVDSG